MELFIVTCITASRVPLALWSCWAMLHQQWDVAWSAFMCCVVTDVMDGRLAREWGVVTRGGAWLDLVSDIAIFYIYVPAAYWYSQRYSPWWQTHAGPWWVLGIVCLAAALLTTFGLVTNAGKALFRWYRQKGNFWCGVIPVGVIGGWMAWQTSPWALGLTIGYGVLACYVNREKIKGFL